MSDPIEWEFGVPASQVDVRRIWEELAGASGAQTLAYLGALRQNAPTVYRRLGEWAKENNVMNYWNFQ